MPVTTNDLYIAPDENWVLAVVNPLKCRISRSDRARWSIAFGSAAPSLEVIGQQMNCGDRDGPEVFELDASLGGNIYIRNREFSQGQINGGKSHFSVLAEIA